VQRSFRKTGKVGTLASQPEIGVWVRGACMDPGYYPLHLLETVYAKSCNLVHFSVLKHFNNGNGVSTRSSSKWPRFCVGLQRQTKNPGLSSRCFIVRFEVIPTQTCFSFSPKYHAAEKEKSPPKASASCTHNYNHYHLLRRRIRCFTSSNNCVRVAQLLMPTSDKIWLEMTCQIFRLHWHIVQESTFLSIKSFWFMRILLYIYNSMLDSYFNLGGPKKLTTTKWSKIVLNRIIACHWD